MNDAATEYRDETANRTALGTLLIERGFLDSDRLDEALRVGAETGERLGEVVVRMGWASEDDLARTLADQWRLRYVERSAISFDGDALSRMSREEATRLEALPMRVSEDGSVVVALAEPTDARFLALHELLGDRIDCVVVAKSAIDAGLRSDLLPKDGSTAPAVTPADEPSANGHEQHEENGAVASDETAAVGEPTATDFDEVARTLTEGLGAQLASLRAIVAEAESTRERDRGEIARLTAELDDRRAELADRNGTIESMQQKLRELADSLEHRS